MIEHLLESLGELNEVLLLQFDICRRHDQLLPSPAAQILRLLLNELIIVQALENLLEVTADINFPLEADYLTEIPEVKELVPLISLRQGEWRNDLSIPRYCQVESSRLFEIDQ